MANSYNVAYVNYLYALATIVGAIPDTLQVAIKNT